MSGQSLKEHPTGSVVRRYSRIVLLGVVAVFSAVVMIAVFLFVYSDPSGYSLSFSASEKVCQLTGKADWDTGENIAERTGAELPFGFTGTDGGYPVEHNSPNHPKGMALFFGDSRFKPPRLDPEHVEDIPDDAIGWISTHSPPNSDRCLGVMTINPKSPVVGPTIKQGLFNVATGGISSAGVLYGFFWTAHCNSPDDKAKCPENASLNRWGTGYLAESHDDGETFVDRTPMPRDFVLSTAVDGETAFDLPPEQRLGIYVFGVPRHRDSVPYLAYAPPGTIADPGAWKFFVGRKPNGQPSWIDREEWDGGHRPGHPDLFESIGCGPHVGEFSVTWNRVLHVWLLLYQDCNPSGSGGQVVVFRVAAAPWGPWSDASILLDPNRDHPWCHLLWEVPRVKRCGILRIEIENSKKHIAVLTEEIDGATGTLKQHLTLQRNIALQQLARDKVDLTRCDRSPPGGIGGCDAGHHDDWTGVAKLSGNQNGDFYAPYVMERYTTSEQTFLPSRRRATIYWLLSTWNPYQVVVMKTSLTVEESATAKVVGEFRSVIGTK
jgi:hypothetical protein